MLVVLTISRHSFGLSLNNQQEWKLALTLIPKLHCHIRASKTAKTGLTLCSQTSLSWEAAESGYETRKNARLEPKMISGILMGN
ncbi:hypothetical protein QUA99_32160, partial [Microcoleus sp. F10-B2]